ncbi:hypothetical protein PVOR_21434 [Paenibacillus vortex V453]|uniref:ABC transporter domain-containing protein n=1 Tax=Paenibacillus vortex V453 TaxID=715225 RepID=A0A2R9SRA5_9BACL|nr:hypothetical protein PVOR_21434 [Paenibacillus vortex V453]
MEPILSIHNLSKSFMLHNLDKHIKAIDRVDFELQEGEFVGITGKSGSGKSTILKSIYRTYVNQRRQHLVHLEEIRPDEFSRGIGTGNGLFAET